MPSGPASQPGVGQLPAGASKERARYRCAGHLAPKSRSSISKRPTATEADRWGLPTDASALPAEALTTSRLSSLSTFTTPPLDVPSSLGAAAASPPGLLVC